jgi:hypothetical protein
MEKKKFKAQLRANQTLKGELEKKINFKKGFKKTLLELACQIRSLITRPR